MAFKKFQRGYLAHKPVKFCCKTNFTKNSEVIFKNNKAVQIASNVYGLSYRRNELPTQELLRANNNEHCSIPRDPD